MPPLEMCGREILDEAGFAENEAEIESIVWDGDVYCGENGESCRDAAVSVKRKVWDCTAVYEGEASLPDYNRYRLLSEYEPVAELHLENSEKSGTIGPDLERKINWRLYKEYSCGLVTELATHQLQVGNWALRMLPEKVSGMGDIIYWKDGREVYDSINLIYHYPNGVKMTYESMIANKFYGLEEEILGSKGTMEPEKGRYYFEEVEPAPGILQLINQIEHKIFDNVSFAGPSWVPETASVNKAHYIVDNMTSISGQSSVGASGDGSIELVTAFCEASIMGKPVPDLVEEAYYSSVLGLLGLQAIDEGRVVTFPDEYKIPYLNFA